jgi:hypothetical protein
MQMAEVQLLGVAAPTALPVKLLSFTSRLNNGAAYLQWSVADPEAGDQYEVQRSADGKNFASIHTITNTGNQSALSYTDAGLSDAAVYYRLRLTDRYGVTTFSGINLLKGKSRGMDVTIYPNPVPKGSPVQLSISEAILESWKLVDVAGKVIASGINMGVSGATSLSLPASVTAGTYYLQLQTNKGTENRKLILQ